MNLAETVWSGVIPFPQFPQVPYLADSQYSQYRQGLARRTGTQELKVCTHPNSITSAQLQVPPFSLSPYSLVTPLPGSHDELIPQGIKSKLGEIPDSRVGEVRDPWLQIWRRQTERGRHLCDCWTNHASSFRASHQRRSQQLRWSIELKALEDLGFTCPPL